MMALVITILAASRAALTRANAQLEARARELADTNDNLTAQIAGREKAEEALRQSQKMEAVGQLTGGIAHDFNNMLAIISGNLSLLLRRVAQGRTDIAQYAESAQDGARRAATLTQKLLAFSRRQPLKPTPINANSLMSGMSDLLRRTIGAHIRFETVVAAGLWPTFADQSQLETSVLNLVVNACDAMPDGGVLTIETANAYLDEAYVADHDDVAAGQYVMIAVSDTGGGMPADVVAKAFEPFFTTKAVGKGTGLGLSQVYGFVKQSRGHIKIYTEVNQGTTVKLYLPRLAGAMETDAKPQERPQLPLGSPSEVILVVEDEEKVRRVTVDSLRELGYTVRHADGVRSALKALESQPNVALLFTDIIMPDGSGRTLADEATHLWPSLKVLFTTGYTRNAIVHNGIVDADVQLLLKPFSFEQLAAKVRDVLGGPKAA
jgi:signal transduction histidine kinase